MTNQDARIRGRFFGSGPVMDLLLRRGKVAAIRRAGRSVPDLGGDDFIIAPPLFDIQMNGAFGIDLQSPDLTTEEVHALNAGLNRQGVFRWMPTLITDSIEAMEHRCHVIANALDDRALARCVPGIHLEGPHISPEDGPRGAHPRAHVTPPRIALFHRLQRAAKGRVRCVTLAPELPGATGYIRAITGHGVVAALGHHAAETDRIAAAAAAGARLCTHLGNGVAPRIHRHHNGLWPQLADNRLYASFIADLEHIPPDTLCVFARAKGPERVILTSDSVSLAGMKPGRYHIFGADVEMKRSGRVCLAGTELLAGSTLMLLQGVWNMHCHTDLTLEQAFAAASQTPARLFGATLPAWPPKTGRKASLILCQPVTVNKHTSRLALRALVQDGVMQRILS